MKRLFTFLSVLALLLASAVWIVLLAWTPEAIAGLGEFPSGVLYFVAIFSLGSGGAVVAFGDRCLQFIGAVCCILAFLGLAAFHSAHTHNWPAAVATVPCED